MLGVLVETIQQLTPVTGDCAEDEEGEEGRRNEERQSSACACGKECVGADGGSNKAGEREESAM